ncbi:XAP5, circadian clock regulator-domain-containing protein [Macrophomina phaseolina]|uniref:XAP5, circadian clock regulator-domain-containing protein n=1 Tax=Macrophomina phaseolina TaxID=35725 RepID=A0ABQ8GFJ9_9PEZI|nr:XAP5, circadian clock regulator-domain-containing protein [Macrophomina phaseolina]
MDRSNPSSADPSRSNTPNPSAAANSATSRFTSQASTAEDLLKSQTVGLVHLSDFRKRRAEALDLKDRERQEQALGRGGSTSGASTPGDGGSTPRPAKKKKKTVAKGKLSFGLDDDDEAKSATSTAAATPRSGTPDENGGATASDRDKDGLIVPKKKLGANSNVAFKPKVMTKSALLREAQQREQLRKEFLIMQEAVKATDFVIPFVFYDGTNTPGGRCKIKKGEHVWLFLDKARKMGAELGVGGDKSRREWARVGVDDLMLVRGEIIIPHHYDFYHFMVNKTIGFAGPIFGHSAQPTAATPMPAKDEDIDPSTFNPLERQEKKKDARVTEEDAALEGYNDDPALTKVVDRRWYERNKHIFPASIWEEFDPNKDYSKGVRKDALGNSFFFS